MQSKSLYGGLAGKFAAAAATTEKNVFVFNSVIEFDEVRTLAYTSVGRRRVK